MNENELKQIEDSRRYEPVEDERRFLDAYLQRKIKESWGGICHRAGLERGWFTARSAAKPEFLDWFLDEVRRRRAVTILELIDLIKDNQLRAGAKLHAELLKILRDWLDPKQTQMEIKVKHEHRVEVSLPKTRAQVADFLEREAAGRMCRQCGMPIVDFAAFRLGMDVAERRALPQEVRTDYEDVIDAAVIESEPEKVEELVTR